MRDLVAGLVLDDRFHIQNVYVERLGLADGNEHVEIAVGECSATMSWCSETSPRKREKIEQLRLDDWRDACLTEGHPNRLDFVKIAAEGQDPKFVLRR
jgi:hypothetical protein